MASVLLCHCCGRIVLFYFWITIRREYRSVNYLGFVLLACMVIVLRTVDF